MLWRKRPRPVVVAAAAFEVRVFDVIDYDDPAPATDPARSGFYDDPAVSAW